MGAQHPHHRHRVAGGLDHHLVFLGQAAGEALQPGPGHVDPAVRPQPAVLPDHHLREGAVDVHADDAPHPVSLLMATGAVGDTTTTDPRSRRNRAGRRGGQLLTRARGSSSGSACPRFVLPAPRSPDGHTIREDHAIPTGCSSATSTMPVTNPIESTFATVRLRTERTKGCLSRETALAMVFKLAKSAERHWRRLDGTERLAQVIAGVRFRDGEPVQATEEQAAA